MSACECACVQGGGGGGGAFFLSRWGNFFKASSLLFYFASLTWRLLPRRFLFHAKVGETHAHLANLVSVSFCCPFNRKLAPTHVPASFLFCFIPVSSLAEVKLRVDMSVM